MHQNICREFEMSNNPTLSIVDVFSVVKKEEPEYVQDSQHEWLSREKPNFCDCDEDMLVKICLEVEAYESNSDANVDLIAVKDEVKMERSDRELGTDMVLATNCAYSTELPSTSGSHSDDGDRAMSQALDLRLRINATEEGIEQQRSNADDSDIEAQYKIVKVKEHVRKIKVGAKKKSRPLYEK